MSETRPFSQSCNLGFFLEQEDEDDDEDDYEFMMIMLQPWPGGVKVRWVLMGAAARGDWEQGFAVRYPTIYTFSDSSIALLKHPKKKTTKLSPRNQSTINQM